MIPPRKQWKNYTFSSIIVDRQVLCRSIVMYVITEQRTTRITLRNYALAIEVINTIARKTRCLASRMQFQMLVNMIVLITV
jgi:hypothetical protein